MNKLLTRYEITSRVSKAMVEICDLDRLWVGVGDPFGMAVTHAVASGMVGLHSPYLYHVGFQIPVKVVCDHHIRTSFNDLLILFVCSCHYTLFS